MASRDKYGSPYDLFNGGKVQRPQGQSQEERKRERHQLRGCRDPNCQMCNPETAGRGYGGVRGVTFGSPSGVFGSVGDAPRGIWIGYDTAAGYQAVTTSAPGNGVNPKAPPQAYNEAREAVEGWVLQTPEQSFDDIVGNEEALAQLKDAIRAPVEHKALYEAYGMKMPKGALLSGPPGCGKTMFARAAASEMKRLYGEGVEFVSISGSELQSMFVGETEQRIKAIFTYAREYKAFRGHPLLVFMDEAEVLLPDRTGRVRRLASWEESQVATFLAEMDGIQESGAFVLLATNRPEVIDQAVLRDGRCDFKIAVKRPTMAALEIILRKVFAGALVQDGVTDDELAFAAMESFRDPHKVILEANAIGIDLEHMKMVEVGNKHFLFEHILSGAMAASIPARAKRYAFARDKADGVARGVTVDDVIRAVTDLFEENRGLDHSFALEEFRRVFLEETTNKQQAHNQTRSGLN